MFKLDIEKLIDKIKNIEGDKKIEETEGMLYIDKIIKQDGMLVVEDIDFDLFSLEDMTMYFNLWDIYGKLNKEGNKIYKNMRHIKPRIVNVSRYI